VPLFEASNNIAEKLGNKKAVAVGLGAIASVALTPMGALQAAEANVRRRISACREMKNEFEEAVGHGDLGRLLAYRGAYAESEAELRTSTSYWTKTTHVQGQGVDEAYRALRELLRLRWAACHGDLKFGVADLESPLSHACRALELADTAAQSAYPVERDYVEAHWLLGAANRVAGQADEAERHLHEALERCRRIALMEMEADILIDLARLRAATGAADEAQRLAEEALVITERSDYVLQGADAHLELAKLALARGDKATAKEHARKAKELATCDGPPDYTYQAAYEEAGTLLAELEPDR
jgi:tetratricopeptide (TPR) repeat protein